MEDKTLLKLALFISVFGLLVLYAFSSRVEVGEMGIKENTGETVKVTGFVKDVKRFGNLTMIELSTNNEVKVVVFENLALDAQEIEVVGEIKEYRGEQEIVARSIKAIG